MGVGADHLVEALAELRLLDLGRIPLADGVDNVREMNAAPKEVDHVIQPRDADPHQTPPLQTGQSQRTETVLPLRGEVVDREGRGHIGERAVAVKAVQQIGHKSGMPVVDVDHVRLEVQRAEHLEQRAAEIDEARVVVTEPVHAVAVIQRRTVDEVDRHLADAAFIDGCLDRL